MMAVSGPYVVQEREGPVALLRLSHPPVNALSQALLEELQDRFSRLEGDPEVRVVILTSALDRVFSAGADIREMERMSPAQARIHGSLGQKLTRQIERMTRPVLATVHGACFGGGFEIAMSCDAILASDDAQFGQPEIHLGIMPGWGGTCRLPRRLGVARSRWAILSGESISATEACQVGLVLRVVPREELLPTAREMANVLARQSPVALAAAKYSMLQAIDPHIDQRLEYERDLWSRLFGIPDAREGLAAFLAKRSPQFVSHQEWTRYSRGFPWETASPSLRQRQDRQEKRKKR